MLEVNLAKFWESFKGNSKRIGGRVEASLLTASELDVSQAVDLCIREMGPRLQERTQVDQIVQQTFGTGSTPFYTELSKYFLYRTALALDASMEGYTSPRPDIAPRLLDIQRRSGGRPTPEQTKVIDGLLKLFSGDLDAVESFAKRCHEMPDEIAINFSAAVIMPSALLCNIYRDHLKGRHYLN